jgi:hypothetical protein
VYTKEYIHVTFHRQLMLADRQRSNLGVVSDLVFTVELFRARNLRAGNLRSWTFRPHSWLDRPGTSATHNLGRQSTKPFNPLPITQRVVSASVFISIHCAFSLVNLTPRDWPGAYV